MPDSTLAALISDETASPFRPRHQNFEPQYQRLLQVANPPGLSADFFAGLKLSSAAIQSLIAGAVRDGVTFRAMGGG
jgi:hypothetical protein